MLAEELEAAIARHDQAFHCPHDKGNRWKGHHRKPVPDWLRRGKLFAFGIGCAVFGIAAAFPLARVTLDTHTSSATFVVPPKLFESADLPPLPPEPPVDEPASVPFRPVAVSVTAYHVAPPARKLSSKLVSVVQARSVPTSEPVAVVATPIEPVPVATPIEPVPVATPIEPVAECPSEVDREDSPRGEVGDQQKPPEEGSEHKAKGAAARELAPGTGTEAAEAGREREASPRERGKSQARRADPVGAGEAASPREEES